MPYRLTRALAFPPAETADEDGLVAVGGDLRPERLVLAYASGIFPWPHQGYPLLWFSLDPRTVIPCDRVHVSRRLARTLRTRRFRVTLDTAFEDVIDGCATVPRRGNPRTWITPAMREAYVTLHRFGFAHSAECWREGRLVGGVYGVSVGAMLVGESMFTRVADASKVALVTLIRQIGRWGFPVLDAQMRTEHVARLGAEDWPRSRYLGLLGECLERPTRLGPWALDPDL